eukprot:CAMPEP_0179958584 /NCGR_PEP_ID=MMETSP0983-20121128/28110_1 /TAXON_ID=483367 /ORGANISM="non described non described, Strain CCMP 2436" /LENGTH=347 /DNA_ID=CAMNT_0021870727 /DNA_START=383 /DNA_END=1427 /DNA_ORIENTATION=-
MVLFSPSPRGSIPLSAHGWSSIEVHLWHPQPRHVFEVLRELLCVGRLAPIVNFFVDDSRVLRENFPTVAKDAIGRAVEGHCHFGEDLQVLQVDAKKFLEAGPLHLDAHALALPCRRQVHLPERRGGQRNRVKLGERVWSELSIENLVDLGERKGRALVLQRRELLDERGRHHVDARREQLAELDEGGAELEKPLLTLARKAPFVLRRAWQLEGDRALKDERRDEAPDLRRPSNRQHPRCTAQPAEPRVALAQLQQRAGQQPKAAHRRLPRERLHTVGRCELRGLAGRLQARGDPNGPAGCVHALAAERRRRQKGGRAAQRAEARPAVADRRVMEPASAWRGAAGQHH